MSLTDSKSSNLLASSEFDTPAVVVDLNAVETNIARLMNSMSRFSGVSVRPHLKTAKSPEFAKMLLDKGAKGICVAKVSEAEVFAAAGITDILITTEIAGKTKISRLMQLHSICPDLKVVVDNLQVAQQLNDACIRTLRDHLKVFIDLDVGQNRTGVSTLEDALKLAKAIKEFKHLNLIGLQGYEGHLQHLEAAKKKELCLEAMAKLTAVADALRAQGHKISTVTTGGTGTAEICASHEGITEVQPGSFIFMDTSYRNALNGTYQNALTVHATVVSKKSPSRVVVDAGTKSLSLDMGFAEVADHRHWSYSPAGDEHGIVESKAGDIRLVPGDRIVLIPSHIDTTVALHDRYQLTRQGIFEGALAITARGKVQ